MDKSRTRSRYSGQTICKTLALQSNMMAKITCCSWQLAFFVFWGSLLFLTKCLCVCVCVASTMFQRPFLLLKDKSSDRQHQLGWWMPSTFFEMIWLWDNWMIRGVLIGRFSGIVPKRWCPDSAAWWSTNLPTYYSSHRFMCLILWWHVLTSAESKEQLRSLCNLCQAQGQRRAAEKWLGWFSRAWLYLW